MYLPGLVEPREKLLGSVWNPSERYRAVAQMWPALRRLGARCRQRTARQAAWRVLFRIRFQTAGSARSGTTDPVARLTNPPW